MKNASNETDVDALADKGADEVLVGADFELAACGPAKRLVVVKKVSQAV